MTALVPKWLFLLLMCAPSQIGLQICTNMLRKFFWPSWEKLWFARSLYQILFQISPTFYHSMLVPWHDTMPSFMISMWVLDLHEFKNQVSRCSRPSHDAQMFEYRSHISCMGPRNSPKDTHVIFQPTLVHRSMCLQFKFGLCTLKSPETQLMYKRPNKPGIIPKFNRALI